jgi:hypothetical protein
MKLLTKFVLIAAVSALAISIVPVIGFAGAAKSTKAAAKAKMVVPPGACVAGNEVIENGKLCATGCNEYQWCNVNLCSEGKLHQTLIVCYEPSGLCTPKC